MLEQAMLNDTIAIPGFSEPFCSISHLLAAVVALLLAPRILRLGRGEWPRLSSVLVYLFGVIFLFTMSGVYHSLEPHGTPRMVMQRMDHAAIWVLIAGTFTPIQVVAFRHWVWRWGGLVVIWTIAITGLVLKTVFFTSLPPAIGVGFYLGMGWLGLFLIFRLVQLWGLRHVTLMWLGGVSYSVGATFELIGAPVLIPGIIGPHELFHVAVIGGALLHGFFIRQVLLRNPAQAEVAPQPVTGELPVGVAEAAPAVA